MSSFFNINNIKEKIKAKKEQKSNKELSEREFYAEYLGEIDDFNVDLDKGLYLGSGMKMVGTADERKTVMPIYVQWGDLAGHLAVYGTTRVGKTRLMVSMIRQCILKGWDIFIVEPKGAVGGKKNEGKDVGVGQETMGWVMQFAEEAGRLADFKYISPYFPETSLKFNPLFAMANEEIASLISTIVPAKDEFFATMGYQITMSVLLGLEAIEKSKGEAYQQRLMTEAYQLFYNNEEEGAEPSVDSVELIVHGDNSAEEMAQITPPSRVLVTFADINEWANKKKIGQLYEIVKNLSTSLNVSKLSKDEKREFLRSQKEALTALDEMNEKDNAYYSKVSSSFNLIMSQLATGNLGKLLCTVKINPVLDGLLKKEGGQILLIQPFPLVFKDASDAFVRVFFAILTSMYGNIGASGRAGKREVAMFVDEGGSVLYQGVENLFNKAGGLGFRIFIFTQSFADYESELGPEVAKIVNDNTNIKIYMRMNDQTSRQLVAESFGQIKDAANKYMGSKLDMRVTAAMDDKDLLLPAHMGDMQKQEFLLQYGEGRFYCCAPNQADPDVFMHVEETKRETILNSMGVYVPVAKKDELGIAPIEVN